MNDQTEDAAIEELGGTKVQWQCDSPTGLGPGKIFIYGRWWDVVFSKPDLDSDV